MNIEIDSTDAKIINELIDDSRISYRVLAKKVGVSLATVMKRVKRLSNTGVIDKFTIRVQYDKIGYDLQALISLRVSKGKFKEVEEMIAKEQNVYAVYDNTGSFDATVIAKFKTRSALEKFVKKIHTYDFIERVETKLLLSTVKESQIKLPT